MAIRRKRWGYKKPIADRVTDRFRRAISNFIYRWMNVFFVLFGVWVLGLLFPPFMHVWADLIDQPAPDMYTAGEYLRVSIFLVVEGAKLLWTGLVALFSELFAQL